MGKSDSPFRRYILLLARLALGGIFIAASIDKIAHPAEFAKIVHNYRILPDSAVNVAAIVLPWLEAIIGALIISGIWLPGAVLIANILLFVFFSALMYNVARGLNVHCGCFSTTASASPQTTWYIIRDSLFLLLGLIVAARVFRRDEVENR